MRHNIEAGFDPAYVHKPVMWREILELVGESRFGGAGLMADCTLGEGGHSGILLAKFPDLKIIAFERDGEILEAARKRLERYSGRIEYINDNYSEIAKQCEGHRGMMHGILYDFGISSFHYEMSGRGFGFTRNEPLDMRLDASGAGSAAHYINTLREKELADMFFTLGGERWARKIARAVTAQRKSKKIETTHELAGIVWKAIPKKFHPKNIHPATRVFQALRIHVNRELDAISKSLDDAFGLLGRGGRILTIAFHSLEDRIAKEKFRRLARGCSCPAAVSDCRCPGIPLAKVLTGKPLVPDNDEIDFNPRARSAKLRACEKL